MFMKLIKWKDSVYKMEFFTFNEIVNKTKIEAPILFGLEHDVVPSKEDILKFEGQHNIQLTEKYKQFLLKYGGGFFGYANLYSLDKGSSFYLLHYNDIPLTNILRIADNGCGDYYVLKIVERKCQDAILFFEHDTRLLRSTKFSDIFEYLVSAGLKG